jgi:O-antigen ligase
MLFAAGLIGVALLTMDGIRSQDRLNTVLKCLVVIGTISGGLGLLSFFLGLYPLNHLKIPGLSATVGDSLSFIGDRSNFRRVAGTARHPIEFGVLMAIVFPLALHYALTTPRPRNRRWWLCFLIIASAIPMSLSRSAIIGVVCASLVLFFTWPRRRRMRTLVIVPVYLVGMRFLVHGLLGTLRNLFTGAKKDNSITHRTDNYKRIGSLVRHQFFFGGGFGTYIPTRNEYVLDNAYLGHLFETGVIGLGILLLLFFAAFFVARGARRRSVRTADRDLAQALAAAMAAVIPSFFTFDAFGYPMATGTVFFIIGCCGAAWRLAGDRQLQAGAAP